jgi:hypothetical protein
MRYWPVSNENSASAAAFITHSRIEVDRIWKEYDLESRTLFKVTSLTIMCSTKLTLLQTRVTKVTRAETDASDVNPKELGHSRWLVNEDPEPFDAVIVTVGTCGAPKRAHFPGMPGEHSNGTDKGKSYAETIKSGNQEESTSSSSSDEEGPAKHGHSQDDVYEGPIIHSSELDDAELEGKTVVVIGSGASGVEAIETALSKGAKKGVFIARSVVIHMF